MTKNEKNSLLLMLVAIFLVNAPLSSVISGFANLLAIVLFVAGAIWFYRK